MTNREQQPQGRVGGERSSRGEGWVLNYDLGWVGVEVTAGVRVKVGIRVGVGVRVGDRVWLGVGVRVRVRV